MKKLSNNVFSVEFDEGKGIMTALTINADPEKANFIKEGRGFCELTAVPYYTYNPVTHHVVGTEDYKFEKFETEEKCAKATFSRRGVVVRETFVTEEEILRVKIDVKNENAYPFYFMREDFGFFVPFADSYDSSLICQQIRCHTHIAAFGENTWVQAERMGISEHNVGVLLLKGSTYSYSQTNCTYSEERGYLSLNVSSFHLQGGESYEIELVVFAYKGGDDFFTQAKKFPRFIHVEAPEGYVLTKGETKPVSFTTGEKIKTASVKIGNKKLPTEIDGNTLKTSVNGATCGEKKISYEINGRKGEAYFYVSEPLELLQRKRARFIVEHQQCLEKNSPLYGAYLIYDNEEKEQYFDYSWPDHNANRERMSMGVFLAKYLRKTGDKKIEKSLNLFTEFLLRECLDEETGVSFNNIGKAANVTRLYNAPWVILYFCELYRCNHNKRWVDLATKMLILYYENGGTNFYPNGIRLSDILQAIREGGNTEAYNRVLELFDEHIENIIIKGTNYPPHEVRYEQTIVTPAAYLLMEKYLLCKDEKYLREAEKHLKLLIKFNGSQPDYRLNKVPIRYWDNYYFGKTRDAVYGDTLPHPALAHSAHCFYLYGLITGDKKWLDYGKQSWEAGYCFFNAKGEASSSYVYPERVNGKKCAHFDYFADEQDGYLYLIYKMQEGIDA